MLFALWQFLSAGFGGDFGPRGDGSYGRGDRVDVRHATSRASLNHVAVVTVVVVAVVTVVTVVAAGVTRTAVRFTAIVGRSFEQSAEQAGTPAAIVTAAVPASEKSTQSTAAEQAAGAAGVTKVSIRVGSATRAGVAGMLVSATSLAVGPILPSGEEPRLLFAARIPTGTTGTVGSAVIYRGRSVAAISAVGYRCADNGGRRGRVFGYRSWRRIGSGQERGTQQKQSCFHESRTSNGDNDTSDRGATAVHPRSTMSVGRTQSFEIAKSPQGR